MKKLVALFALASVAGAQEDGPKPTKHHEMLKMFEGTWDGKVKFFMEPGKDPVTSTGVMTQTLSCGGMWIVFDWKGDMMGQPFTGHGLMGYDIKKEKFVGTWVDSWTTSISISEGTYDEKTKSFTMLSDDVDPQSGKKVKRKEVTEIKSADHHVMKMFMDDTQVMEIEFKKKQK